MGPAVLRLGPQSPMFFSRSKFVPERDAVADTFGAGAVALSAVAR